MAGGAPRAAAGVNRGRDGTGNHVVEGDGLTETAPVLTTTLMSEVAKPGSIGRPVPGIELKVERFDADGFARDEYAPRRSAVAVEPHPFKAEPTHQEYRG